MRFDCDIDVVGGMTANGVIEPDESGHYEHPYPTGGYPPVDAGRRGWVHQISAVRGVALPLNVFFDAVQDLP